MKLEGLKGGEGVCDRIKKLATKNALADLPDGSSNRLAYNGAPRRENISLAAAYQQG
jgi:hypothetical protein